MRDVRWFVVFHRPHTGQRIEIFFEDNYFYTPTTELT
jgi:hypothetical protein